MLILNRRVGEVLRIGDQVVINVMEAKGSQARFGVQAPMHIPVYREEIREKMIENARRKKAKAAAQEATEPDSADDSTD